MRTCSSWRALNVGWFGREQVSGKKSVESYW